MIDLSELDSVYPSEIGNRSLGILGDTYGNVEYVSSVSYVENIFAEIKLVISEIGKVSPWEVICCFRVRVKSDQVESAIVESYETIAIFNDELVC